MALFQPTNITPSSFSGAAAGTVDVTEKLTVSWQVNGNSPMTAYKVIIMQNDTASTQVLDTGKVSLSSPFYGTNYKGETQYFSCYITASQMSTAGMTNGYANGYKLQITQYWTEGGVEKNIVQTSASYFITRSTPTLTMDAIPSPVTNKAYTFTATYAQAQGDTVEWMQWEIQLADSTEIYDTGKIYGTPDIKAEYDGFFTGVSYRVKCTVQTENGIEATTDWVAFTVEYATTSIGTVTACAMCDRDAIKVDLPSSAYIMGRASGNVTYRTDNAGDNWVVLGDIASSVVWNEGNASPLSIANPYSLAISGYITSISQPITFLTISSQTYTASMSVDANGFKFQRSGETLAQLSVPIVGGEFFRIVATEDYFSINVYSFSTPPLFPSNTLYPSNSLYPSEGSRNSVTYSKYLTTWQTEPINSIAIYGPIDVDFLWIKSGKMEQTEIADIINGVITEPVYSDDTEFLALFDNTLSAGSLYSTQDINGYSVYRKTANQAYFSHLVDLPIGTKYFYDYGAVSQQTYQYYIYAATDSTYAASALSSQEVTPVFWNYTLMCCEADTDGVYHVLKEYQFALDVSSGVQSNNNSPSVLQNFTRYPMRQPVNSNYRGGTLSAYIGSVKDGAYVDSVSLMQELYALSTSMNAKFLKTRKGELFRVETSAPITMQLGDIYAAQPAKISLPWVEIGDSSNDSIVITENVLAVPNFYIDPNTMQLVMNYSNGVSPDSFSMSNSCLYINDPGQFENIDYSITDDMYLMLNIDSYLKNQ